VRRAAAAAAAEGGGDAYLSNQKNMPATTTSEFTEIFSGPIKRSIKTVISNAF
jgi:hypothetical protein